MSTLVSIGIGIALACGIFYGGMLYERRENLAVQNQQLKDDAVAVSGIEEKDDARKAKVVEIVRVVKESPEAVDWFSQPMPGAACDGLRAAGVRARPEADC